MFYFVTYMQFYKSTIRTAKSQNNQGCEITKYLLTFVTPMYGFRPVAERLQVYASMENDNVEDCGGQSCAYHDSHSTAHLPYHTRALPNVLCDVPGVRLRSFFLVFISDISISMLPLRRWRTPSAVVVHALARALDQERAKHLGNRPESSPRLAEVSSWAPRWGRQPQEKRSTRVLPTVGRKTVR